MKVTEYMILQFAGGLGIGAGAAHYIEQGLARALKDVPDVEALLPFARAAAAHTCSDGVDEWNALIEAWDALPGELQRDLLKREA